MAAGFQSYTPDGRLQFSSDYMSYYFLEKGTRLMSQNGLAITSDPKYPDPTINFLWTFPITFTEQGQAINAIPYADNDILIYNCVTPLINTSSTQPATNVADQTLNWWRFRPYSNFTPSGFGLQIFQANGNLAYDAQAKALLVKTKVDNVTMTGASMNTPLGLPGGRVYAGYMPVESYRIFTTYSNSLENPQPNANLSGFAVATNGDVSIHEVAKSFASEDLNNGTLLIFDVTGY